MSVSEETPADGVDPEVSIILNVEKDETEEQEVTEALPVGSHRDAETPRPKKKKSKKSDSQSTNVSILEASSDSSITSKKKKKKNKERQEEEEQQQEVVVVLEKKKKKSKKRKLEQEEVQENMAETPVVPLETRSKKKKKKTEAQEEQPEVEELLPENPESPEETSRKKRRRSRKRKRKQGEEVQSEERPVEGDRDPETELAGRKISFNPRDGSSTHTCVSSRWRSSSGLHPKETLQEEAEQHEATKAPLSTEEQQDIRTQEEVSV